MSSMSKARSLSLNMAVLWIISFAVLAVMSWLLWSIPTQQTLPSPEPASIAKQLGATESCDEVRRVCTLFAQGYDVLRVHNDVLNHAIDGFILRVAVIFLVAGASSAAAFLYIYRALRRAETEGQVAL